MSQIPLPYAFVNQLPFYEWVRIPGRMDMMIKLALAMWRRAGRGRVAGPESGRDEDVDRGGAVRRLSCSNT